MSRSRSDLEHARGMRETIAKIQQRNAREREHPGRLDPDELEELTAFSLVLIGEAAKRLSAEAKGLAPEITWREVIGLRNFLVHQYEDRDPEGIEKTVREDLPVLDAALERIEQELTS